MSDEAEARGIPVLPDRRGPRRPRATNARKKMPRVAAPRAQAAQAPASMADTAEQAGRAEPIRDFEPDATVTRKSRGERAIGNFPVPAPRRRPGWDYQYVAMTALGQPIEGALAEAYEGGWRPVPTSEMPELATPGIPAANITRFGQMLMMRPMHLTQQAKQEDYAAAKQQERDRMQGDRRSEAMANIPGIVPKVLDFSVEGEMGAYSRQRERDGA